MKKLTTTEFISRAKEVHDQKYDYSQSKYVNARTKVEVVCPEHGPFKQLAQSHFDGYGCKYCSGYGLTGKDALRRFREMHGEKYDYSKVAFKNSRSKVTIVCPEHGPFHQVASSHWEGRGCSKCAGVAEVSWEQMTARFESIHQGKYDYSKANYNGLKKTVTIICAEHGPFKQLAESHASGHGCRACVGLLPPNRDEVLERFRKAHGNRYGYSKMVYLNTKAKVKIICPEHGDFEQSPSGHWGGEGCPKCANKNLTWEEALQRFKDVHGNRYRYSRAKEMFRVLKDKLTITCPEHGVFEQIGSEHAAGRGCWQCSGYAPLTRDEAIDRFRAVHGDSYDYSLATYRGTKRNITIVCPEHGEFSQSPVTHWSGSGCPACANYGFDSTKPAILYYLKITSPNQSPLYKIGITNRTIRDRFSSPEDQAKIQILKTWSFKSGRNALDNETALLRRYKDLKYAGQKVISSGNSELFVCDVLELDDH
ncbi:MAG TPA: DUF723 domain-containing protein [Gammaproteobacteria bacterium]|nr:DUF723 domain-containing protein [Gammaproteobacteria bacterium]